MNKEKGTHSTSGLEIAVIGMSGRFPGAKNIEEFWDNLKNGVESVQFYTEEELSSGIFNFDQLKDPLYVKTRGGYLQDKEYFDAAFFGYAPVEAECLDPQFRFFHECCWEALEHGGYNPETYEGAIGMYAGCSDNYIWEGMVEMADKERSLGFLAIMSMTHRDYLCTRISYRFNLKGPALVIQSACSTALVSIHAACRALVTSECDMALAGGVKILPHEDRSYRYQEGMIASLDGHCRAFDANASGTAVGDGVGVVLLKRLKNALADGDTIYAVIKATALNNDGVRKVGYTAPSIEGQADVIKKALHLSRVDPETITFFECHGTGTVVGDPIEIEALCRAYNTTKRQYCGIGSVKTNIGHLDSAAGVASFIKAVLSVYHRMMPPSLNFKSPNPKIDFVNSPFYVNTSLKEWKPEGGIPLRMGVSSFGVGGTNAHAILEEAPPRAENKISEPSRAHHLVLLSGRSSEALERVTHNLVEFVKKNPFTSLADMAYTLQVGRKSFKHRKMAVITSMEQLVSSLAMSADTVDEATATVRRGTASERVEHLVFMFSGQGAQYVNMARGLYEEEPFFRSQMERCFQVFSTVVDDDIKMILYPEDPTPIDQDNKESRINQTEITQPVIFAIEYSLARLLMRWGLNPSAMIGHSIGEFTAACLSGVFSLEDALKLVALRGKLMQRMPGGDMLSIPTGEKELKPFLTEEVELAASNSTSHCVVSGPPEAIAAFDLRMKEKGFQTRRLHTSHAFHSRSMEPILQEFKETVSGLILNPPTIPYLSNVTGGWITVEEATNPSYWARHLRQAVRFADGLSRIYEKYERAIMVEVGPGRALATFARQHKEKNSEHYVVNMVRHPTEDVSDIYYVLDKIGQMWLYGKLIDWKTFYGEEKRQRIPLPTYPFSRQRLWIDPEQMTGKRSGMVGGVEQGAGPAGPTEPFFVPSWKRSLVSIPETEENPQPGKWLVFCEEPMDSAPQALLGARVVTLLQNQGHEVIEVRPGATYKSSGPGSMVFTLDPANPSDYRELLTELQARQWLPGKVVHFWSLTYQPDRGDDYIRTVDRGYFSLLFLAQAVGSVGFSQPMEWIVVSDGMQSIMGEDIHSPIKATLLGPVMVIPVEFAHISCRSVDVLLAEPGTKKEAVVLRQIMEELAAPYVEAQNLVAYRGNYRFVQVYEPVALSTAPNKPLLREQGVYLITGGLGGIGGVLAKHMAKEYRARLLLTGRTSLPAREEWQKWLSSHSVQDPVSRRIRLLEELESMGAEVEVFGVDIADEVEMERVIRQAEERFGGLHGVFHCAGLPGGGMIQVKERSASDRVLRPKVNGALVLEKVLQGRELDFILLFSSINSILARLGQVDYFSANAFLDAYAHYKTAHSGILTVSINWESWLEVGMAIDAMREWSGAQDVGHPLLDYCMKISANQSNYLSYFRLDSHWVVSEHMTVDRKGIAPGVTYLEMAHDAFLHSRNRLSYIGDKKTGLEPVELRDVHFLNLMVLEMADTREVVMELSQDKDETRFLVKSRPTGINTPWQNHAAGQVAFLDSPRPAAYDIPGIEARCTKAIIENPDQSVSGEVQEEQVGEMLIVGPRWQNRRKICIGENEGLAFQQINKKFQGDFDFYYLHPGLLDMATSFMFSQVNPGNLYIPFSYKRVRVFQPIPPHFVCYNRLIDGGDKRKEVLRFNVTIMDEAGNPCIEIEEFTMLQVTMDIMGRINQKEEAAAMAAEAALKAAEAAATPVNETIPAQQGMTLTPGDMLNDGISPAAGLMAITRILGAGIPQIVVSTKYIPAEVFRNNRPGGEQQPGKAEEAALTTGGGLERPELSSDYVVPRTETEKLAAAVLQDVLGLREVGILDDFFELGGDSLKGLSVTGRLQKETHVAISMAELFKRPTAKALADYIDTHRKEEATDTGEMAIQPAEEWEYYPISSGQKRLYILHMMEPDLIVHNLVNLYNWNGHMDIPLMENVVKRFIQRHESTRTSFSMIENILVQRVHAQVDFKLDFIDGEQSQGRSLQDIVNGIIRPFRLDQPPLLRVTIIRSGIEDYLLCLDIHHLIADGTSIGIVFKELTELYSGRVLPAVPFQYKDYTQWQQRSSNEYMLKKQQAFWLEMFSGELPVLDLPYDYERPAVQSHEGSILLFNLGTIETRMMNEIARETGTTLFMTSLALFYLLLAKMSNQEDIVVGNPSAGRKQPEFQSIVGIFINTLAIRNCPAAGKTVREFLAEVKDSTLNAFDNQDYPFENLVESLSLTRDLSRSALFDVMLIVHNELPVALVSNANQGGQAAENTREEELAYVKSSIEFDLIWEIFNAGDHLKIMIDYCTALFKKETIRRFAYYFNTMIKAVSANPDAHIRDLEMMTEDEKRQVMEIFNRTGLSYPGEKTLVELFEEQAARVPGELALVDVGDNPGLSYRELQERVNALAGVLVNRGVIAGTIVALMVERSARMMVALLAILKSGGAYCPMDTEYPRGRVSYILEKSGAALLLTTSKVIAQWGEIPFANEIIDISSEEVELSGFGEPLKKNTSPVPSDLAYVIYTSGSTGNPKGVMIEHRNMVNFIFSMRELIDFVPGKSILALTTISFDIFSLETLLPLAVGMTVVIADEAVQTDPGLLQRKIIESQVHMLQLTPSRLQILLSIDPELECLHGVSELLVGGEALPFYLFKVVKERYHGRFYNMYGPTETTVWSAVKDLTAAEGVTIGKPIGNTQVYITNSYGRLQPVGIPGELWISGAGVGCGYRDNEALTTEKFIENPFVPGLRVYKTGDLARWLPDGDLEFLGRMDNQVKIRGYRIELEEIEEQLVSYEYIKEAVVIPVASEAGGFTLSAYIVLASQDLGKDSDVLTVTPIRNFLSLRLPEYMFPGQFIQVEQIPLTPNGKVDRRALVESGKAMMRTAATYIAPETEMEQKVADAWKQVLNLEKVSLHDNFFDLGGNSMTLIRLNTLLSKELKLEVPVVDMFKHRTIKTFVQYLSQESTEMELIRMETKQPEQLDRAKNLLKKTVKKRLKGVAND